MKVVRQARLELSGGSTPDLLRPPVLPPFERHTRWHAPRPPCCSLRIVVQSTCGDSFADLSIASGAALLAYVNCTLASNTAYSSSAGAVTFASGSYLIFDEVTSSARPLYMGGLSIPTDLRLEVISTDATLPLSVTLAEYVSGGVCVETSVFANTSIDGCPSNAMCHIAAGADSSNSSQCLITYTQYYNSDDGSNDSLYGLFALLALPVFLVIGALALRAAGSKAREPAEMPELEVAYAEGYPAPGLDVWNTPATEPIEPWNAYALAPEPPLALEPQAVYLSPAYDAPYMAYYASYMAETDLHAAPYYQ